MKLGVRTWAGTRHDEFIQLTEGVMASEDLDDPVDGRGRGRTPSGCRRTTRS